MSAADRRGACRRAGRGSCLCPCMRRKRSCLCSTARASTVSASRCCVDRIASHVQLLDHNEVAVVHGRKMIPGLAEEADEDGFGSHGRVVEVEENGPVCPRWEVSNHSRGGRPLDSPPVPPRACAGSAATMTMPITQMPGQFFRPGSVSSATYSRSACRFHASASQQLCLASGWRTVLRPHSVRSTLRLFCGGLPSPPNVDRLGFRSS